MAHKSSPAYEATKAWILAQPPGIAHTCKSVMDGMKAEGREVSSGGTSVALHRMKESGLVRFAAGPTGKRGVFYVMPRCSQEAPPQPLPLRPLPPPHVLQAVEALHKVQDGLHELELALLFPYTATTREASA